MLLDDSIGTLTAQQYTWGKTDGDGNILNAYSTKLETEPCKRSDVNFSGEEVDNDAYKFWKPQSIQEVDIDRFFGIFQCLKEEPGIVGDYNAAYAK